VVISVGSGGCPTLGKVGLFLKQTNTYFFNYILASLVIKSGPCSRANSLPAPFLSRSKAPTNGDQVFICRKSRSTSALSFGSSDSTSNGSRSFPSCLARIRRTLSSASAAGTYADATTTKRFSSFFSESLHPPPKTLKYCEV